MSCRRYMSSYIFVIFRSNLLVSIGWYCEVSVCWNVGLPLEIKLSLLNGIADIVLRRSLVRALHAHWKLGL